MKIKNANQIGGFIEAIEHCSGAVVLKSPYGDTYNLKSVLSRYVAIGELLKEHGDDMEIFCDNPADEKFLFKFFNEYQEVL